MVVPPISTDFWHGAVGRGAAPNVECKQSPSGRDRLDRGLAFHGGCGRRPGAGADR